MRNDSTQTRSTDAAGKRGAGMTTKDKALKQAQKDEQEPAAWRRRLVGIHDALSYELGDTDPHIEDDMTDEEVREEMPVFWAAKEVAELMDEVPWDSLPSASPERKPHNLNCTVFVYRHRETGTIRALYTEDARAMTGRDDYEHVASLEPRMWIEHHFDDAAIAKATGEKA